ncbi:four helix bundle protein [Oscillatoria amoena NRMC-F 0135]|nr:four helix bundle protein [Oscillatoria amoena NRMC-F 0135]MDL5053568.1 four helix bundle protein [Oscillatoria laete-virens NRMC-F 0139]
MKAEFKSMTGQKSQRPHRKLLAWQKNIDLVTYLYEATGKFPQDERYGLISQIRRAAVSVPSNIAEGAVGRSPEHFKVYLAHSLGSLSELDTQIEIVRRLGYLTPEACSHLEQKVAECTDLVSGLKKSLSRPPAQSPIT